MCRGVLCNAGKAWTKEDDRYLDEAWGYVSVKTIAKNLGRTKNAVALRARRLGFGPWLDHGDKVSWNQFVKALGYKHNNGYLKERLLQAGFPVHMKVVHGINGARFTTVNVDEFWEFAEKNKRLFDFSKMEVGVFGKEPEWVAQKRRLDKGRKVGACHLNTPWTQQQDNELQRLLKLYKYTYTEIASKLGRTEAAVKRRISTLGLKERPIRRDSKFWTEEEIKKLIEMREKGYDWSTIANELNRTALCVMGKYERCLNPKFMVRSYRNSLEKYSKRKDCKHFVRAKGCGLDCKTCKDCEHFVKLRVGEKQKSAYVGVNS